METQKPTPIDIIKNGNEQRVLGLIDTRLVSHGRWKLNGVRGKVLCLIEIFIPDLKFKLNFTPSEKFQDKLLCSWLDAERQNDNFTFTRPFLGNNRPNQLANKIEHLRKLLDDYTNAFCRRNK